MAGPSRRLPSTPSPREEPDGLGAGIEQFGEGWGCVEAAPACAGGWGKDLSELDEAERLLMLAALTARFSAAYLRWMRGAVGETLAFSGVRVLETLESEGPTIMRDIAESLGMTPRNMTAIIDSLEEEGLVRRTPHPHDRRATVIELTPNGCKQANRSRHEAAAWVANAFNNLTLDEQQQYADLLSRVASSFC
jgi:DNA-binding MarR family transcriptional regulator